MKAVKLTKLEAEVLYDAASNVADHADARESIGAVGPNGAALTRAMAKLLDRLREGATR